MKRIEYNLKIYTGTEQEIAIELKKDWGLSLRVIGGMLGVSHQTVGIWVEGVEPTVYEFDESLPDSVNAVAMRIPISKVKRMRKGEKGPNTVKVSLRRDTLVKNIFGEGYKAGVYFAYVLNNHLSNLPKGMQKVFTDFYIKGKTSYTNTDLSYRGASKNRLISTFRGTLSKCLAEKFLKKGG